MFFLRKCFSKHMFFTTYAFHNVYMKASNPTGVTLYMYLRDFDVHYKGIFFPGGKPASSLLHFCPSCSVCLYFTPFMDHSSSTFSTGRKQF
jgi:hypothetical protein